MYGQQHIKKSSKLVWELHFSVSLETLLGVRVWMDTYIAGLTANCSSSLDANRPWPVKKLPTF